MVSAQVLGVHGLPRPVRTAGRVRPRSRQPGAAELPGGGLACGERPQALRRGVPPAAAPGLILVGFPVGSLRGGGGAERGGEGGRGRVGKIGGGGQVAWRVGVLQFLAEF